MLFSRRGPWLAFWFAVCVFPSLVSAQSVTLAWDPSTDASVTGYMVRYGTISGIYPSAVNVGNVTTTTVGGLTPGGTYFAIVEAYNADGVFSDPSNIVSFVVPLNCNYAIDTPAINVSDAAANGSLTVTTKAGCGWTAQSTKPFFTFQNGSARAGSGSVSYALDQNYSINARNGSAAVANQTFSFTQQGAAVIPEVGERERSRADFNTDGFTDLLWQDTTNGYVASWLLQGGHTSRSPVSLSHRVVDNNWRVAGTADFNADGHPDILWHHRTTGSLYLWYMNGVNRIGHTALSVSGIPDTRWKVAGIGDFNGDKKPDIAWQHDGHGWLAVWLMDGTTFLRGVDLNPIRVADIRWRIEGIADFNNDGHSDLLFRHGQTGELALWLMNGTSRAAYQQLTPAAITDREWRIASLIDIDGDQTTDIVWQHDTQGWIGVWYMNGIRRIDAQSFPVKVDTNWKIVGSK